MEGDRSAKTIEYAAISAIMIAAVAAVIVFLSW